MQVDNISLESGSYRRRDSIAIIETHMEQKPWRPNQRFSADDDHILDNLYESIEKYESVTPLVQQPRILLVGTVGAGKSSFINSVESAFRKEYSALSFAGRATGGSTSVTKMYKGFEIKGRNGQPLNFRICDLMGIETEQGLTETDFVNILGGKLNDGQKLSPEKELTQGVKDSGRFRERVQAVVFVVDAGKTNIMCPIVVHKMRTMKRRADDLGIKSLLLLTHIDACHPGEVKDIFTNQEVGDVVGRIGDKLGFQEDDVVPIINYGRYDKHTTDNNILILRALKQMLEMANLTLHEAVDDEMRKQQCCLL